MTIVEFRLQAFMVDNDPGYTKARLRLVNAGHLRRASVERRAPQPTYVWTLDDASIIGYPDIGEREAAKVFSIALSVQSWRFLHSPVILRRVSSLRIKPSPQVSSPTIGMTSPLVRVDERSFIQAARELKKVLAMRGTRGKIMRAALNAYWDALFSARTRSRFLSLWAAFELALNADRPSGKELSGGDLDMAAARITTLGPQDIQALRKLNNRLKHARSLRTYGAESAPFVGRESGTLKRLVDQSFAARLGFSLSPTYDQ